MSNDEMQRVWRLGGSARRSARAWPLERMLLPVAAVNDALDSQRGHWFVWAPVFFGLGILAYFALPYEPSLATSLALAFAGCTVALIAQGRRGLLVAVAASTCVASLGFAVTKIRTEITRAPVLTKQLYRADVTGTLERVEPRAKGGQRLTILVSDIATLAPDQTPKRVRISLRKPNAKLKAGQHIKVRANLLPPPKPALPRAYDFGRTAWYLGIRAVGYTISQPAEIEGPPAGLLADVNAAIERLRQHMGARVQAVIPGETGAIATALITGERGGISEETNDAFRDSGLIHILSISGLHMVIMAGTFYAGFRLLLAAIPAIALRYPIKKWAALTACIAALAYLLVSGAAIATVRAYIMVTIMLLAIILDRPALSMRNVAWAALLILLVTPEALLDAGFQMSFAAVIALISAYEALRHRERPPQDRPTMIGHVSFFLVGIMLTTVIASLAVAPIAAYHFHRGQQLAMIANLIAVPICNFVVMPAALLTLLAMLVGLEALPLTVMAWGIEGMTATAKWVASLPGAVSYIPEFSTLAFACIIAGGLWLTLWRTRLRLAGLVLIAAGFLAALNAERRTIIIADDGDVVAVRQDNGKLAVTPGRRNTFDVSRWLEHDGDARKPKAARETRAYRCDPTGCIARSGDLTIAISKHESSLRDDCQTATVLITNGRVDKACTQPQLIIDRTQLRDGGTHAIYADGGRPTDLRVETVADQRGNRPWSNPPRTQTRRVNRKQRSTNAKSQPKFRAARTSEAQVSAP